MTPDLFPGFVSHPDELEAARRAYERASEAHELLVNRATLAQREAADLIAQMEVSRMDLQSAKTKVEAIEFRRFRE